MTKPTKQLSSVVRVVAANSPEPMQEPSQEPPKAASSKVQIVSSHVEVVDESKKASPKPSVVHVEAKPSVVHVEAINGSGANPPEVTSIILPSRVEIVGGVAPSES